jgi:hypothetical protein
VDESQSARCRPNHSPTTSVIRVGSTRIFECASTSVHQLTLTAVGFMHVQPGTPGTIAFVADHVERNYAAWLTKSGMHTPALRRVVQVSRARPAQTERAEGDCHECRAGRDPHLRR